MNYTRQLKKEIVQRTSDQPCCKIAGLSAYIKCAGTFFYIGGKNTFSLSSDFSEGFDKIVDYANSLYGSTPIISDTAKHKRADFSGGEASRILKETGVIGEGGGLSVNLAIDKYIIENDCCKSSFIKWAFLANGSMTLPDGESKSGYHLEFLFGNYALAQDFCSLLSYFDLMPKTVEKNGYAVYFNNAKDIIDVLYIMGANNAMIHLKNLYREREVNNNLNRQMNCEMSNIQKSVNASIEQRAVIEKIRQTIGLELLKDELKSVCLARLKDPNGTLEQLAKTLGISKSCLNHRMRKIMAIGKQL